MCYKHFITQHRCSFAATSSMHDIMRAWLYQPLEGRAGAVGQFGRSLDHIHMKWGGVRWGGVEWDGVDWSEMEWQERM